MRAIHQLIGCALCIVGIGSAAATSLDTTQDPGSASAATSHSSSRACHNRSDVPGSNHDVTPAASDDPVSGPGNSNDHSGAASSAPIHTQRTHLGWQSLLPGSIQ